MAEAVVSIVLQRLQDLLIGEVQFLYGVKSQVENAKDELEWMRCFMKDADAQARNGDERIRKWVSEITDAAYNLDDVVATFALNTASRSTSTRTEAIKNKLKRFVFILNQGIVVYRVGSEIEGVSSKLQELTSRLQRYGVRELGPTSSNDQSRPTRSRDQLIIRRVFSHVVEDDVVGFHKDISKLVSLLIKNDVNPHRVFSICGMGGLGKTTLAGTIYHHNEVRRHFDAFAWASISQECQVRNVWEEILFHLISPTEEQRREIKSMGDGEVAKNLYGVQKERKCLVVLDDIWTTETWDILKAAFPEKETESRILLTTRNKNVALHMDKYGILHEPQCLDKNESWELFQRKAFFGRDAINVADYEKMKELGEKMLAKCAGLPLAIIVLSGLLSRNQTVYYWEKIQKNVETCIRSGKMHVQDDSRYSGVSWVLSLSYEELPYQLKPCFLHLAHFPEDFEIRIGELCRMWIAEGFTSSEDASYACFNELVERCMVQVGKWSSIAGRIKTCRFHDLMRDLCISQAQEENFLQIMKFRSKHDQHMSCNTTRLTTGKCRRLATYLSDNNFSKELLSLTKKVEYGSLRSFVCFHSKFCVYNNEVLMKRFSECFSFLRVLKFEKIFLCKKLPKEFGKLIHLRLFSLKDSWLEEVPPSIGNLSCLQTLDLRLGSYTSIPNVLWKLEQLRHLYLPSSVHKVIGGKKLILNTLRNLQTLVNLSYSHSHLKDLAQVPDIRKLKVELRFEDFGVMRDIMFNNLESLTLQAFEGGPPKDLIPIISSCPQICKLALDLKLINFLEFSRNLFKLILKNSALLEDSLEKIEKLPNLKVLVFLQNAFEGNRMVFSRGGFLRLESLSLESLNPLLDLEWAVEDGALPCLRHLTIRLCTGLKTVPHGLKYVSTLKEIVIDLMPTEFKTRVDVDGEDFHIVQHVPSLVFLNIRPLGELPDHEDRFRIPPNYLC